MSADNPFEELEAGLQRQALEDKARKLIARARTRLILGKDAQSIFFGNLSMRLKLEVCWEIETAATDGKRLLYNPAFWAGMTENEQLAVTCHEVMHNALGHHCRRVQREPRKWNIACDLAINPLLKEAGFTLPKGCLFPGEGQFPQLAPGLSAEAYYSLLPDLPPGQGGDPGRCGGVIDPVNGDPAALQEAEAERKIDVAQAKRSADGGKNKGKMPGGLARAISEVLEPIVNWREVLREFVTRHAKNDYAWSPPNRRFVHMGLYLPGLRSEELGDVCLAIDTSGSVGEPELNRFAAEVQSILDTFPSAKLTLLYHDSIVQHVQHWSASDGPLVLEPKGGGGTDHRPVFQWIEEQAEPPTCLVCLTDMCSRFPSEGPDYPVLWASTVKGKTAPFGSVVDVST